MMNNTFIDYIGGVFSVADHLLLIVHLHESKYEAKALNERYKERVIKVMMLCDALTPLAGGRQW